MDSTPLQSASNSKLPIKRKTLPSLFPHPNRNPNLSPPPPPFKFHRIWTETDEIQFLEGLLHSNLVFPKDLPLFYHRFSTTMSHPYSHSQLSEKLRRLRKKFRSLSSRLLRRGPAALSPHDHALYRLSEKLWSPQFASTSPFGNSNVAKVEVEEVVGVNANRKNEDMGFGCGDEKISGVASKIVLDVFDQCVKEANVGLLWQGVLCYDRKASSQNFGRRWQEQIALEFEVFAKRLRLVMEDSLNQHSPNL